MTATACVRITIQLSHVMLNRKPRVGERIGFGKLLNDAGVVPAEFSTAVVTGFGGTDGNICWYQEDAKDGQRPPDQSCFIWRFVDARGSEELNRLASLFTMDRDERTAK